MIYGLKPIFASYRHYTERQHADQNLVGCYKCILDPRDDLAHIFYSDKVVFWDYRSHVVNWVSSVNGYPFEMPYYLSESEWNEHVARCLQGIMVAYGDNLMAFADILGCGRTRASNLLNGRTSLGVNERMAIGEHYGLTLWQLLAW